MQYGPSNRRPAVQKRTKQSAAKGTVAKSKQSAATGAKSAEPMALLDADITRLRIELSEKLKIQNHQLSELLKRYEW